MGKISVTSSNVKKGLKVVRGRDWEYGNQDGGPGSVGTIIGESTLVKNWYNVRWENGNGNSYRVGNTIDNDCDLYMYNPTIVKDEYINEARKFFKINHLHNISKQMLIDNDKKDWINEY